MKHLPREFAAPLYDPGTEQSFTGSSFVDKRPLLDPARPEVREYRLCFWDGRVPQGDWTEVKSLTVSP